MFEKNYEYFAKHKCEFFINSTTSACAGSRLKLQINFK